MDLKELDYLLYKTGEGDNDAFARLYSLTIKAVYTFVLSYIKDRTKAEDIAQETFIQVKLKANTYKKGTNARAWLYQVAKNLSLDELRKQKRTTDLNEALNKANSDLACGLNDNTAINYMLSSLDEEKREIVVLHLFWGYKNKEIAKMLNKPIGTILWKYNEAIKTLKKYQEEA